MSGFTSFQVPVVYTKAHYELHFEGFSVIEAEMPGTDQSHFLKAPKSTDCLRRDRRQTYPLRTSPKLYTQGELESSVQDRIWGQLAQLIQMRTMMGAWKPWVLGGILSKCDKVLICKRTPK
jgi:hypothetical protein